MDLGHLCLNCFKEKGEYDVCPHCGYTGGNGQGQSWCIQPGMILSGRYIIGMVIGFGGFGITYKAYDAKLDMKVAIKEFYPQSIANRGKNGTTVEIFTRSQEDTYQNMLERFLEEARNMAVFSKEPDIVTVYDYFEENGTAYIVMELIEGMLLRDYLKEYGRIDSRDAIPLFLDILSALGKLHDNGIIHKDISPDNIYILENNKIKLFDFGAANFQGKKDEEYHSVVIKAGYAPPEQYRKDVKPSPAMDIYAAGALLYEMITGTLPLEATDRLMQDDLVTPSGMGMEIDENLERTILKALALDPEQRFQSVKEFYDTIAESRTVELVDTEKQGRKYLMIQRIMLGILSVAAVAAIVLLVGYKMDFRNYSPEKGTKLNVWMVQGTSTDDAEGTEIAKELKAGFEDKYSDSSVQVTVTPVKEAEYEKKLTEAAASGKLPDVFCTDYQKNSRIECVDLSKVVGKISQVNYLFIEQYEEQYPDKKEIPVGFEMAAYFRNETKEALSDKEGCIELSDVKKQTASGECEWISPGQAKERKKSLKNLAKGKKQSDVKAVAGSLSCWNEVQTATVGGKATQNNKSSKLEIIPVVEKGAILCAFTDAYGIYQSGDKNKEKTAMLFLYYMLGNAAQMKLTSGVNDMLPVNARSYRDYLDGNLAQYRIGAEDGYLEKKMIHVSEMGEDISINPELKMNRSGKGIDQLYGK